MATDLAPSEAEAKEDKGGGQRLEADEGSRESLGAVQLFLEFAEAEVRGWLNRATRRTSRWKHVLSIWLERVLQPPSRDTAIRRCVLWGRLLTWTLASQPLVVPNPSYAVRRYRVTSARTVASKASAVRRRRVFPTATGRWLPSFLFNAPTKRHWRSRSFRPHC